MGNYFITPDPETTGVIGLAPELPPQSFIFHCGTTEEVMRLDKDGMTYKGQRIEDGGEAHKAFLEVMEMMKNNYR